MTKVGIIGCGYWGPNLVRSFSEISGATLAAISDLRPGRLDFIRAKYPGVRTTTSAAEIIGDPSIDAVVIATPPKTHHALAMAAIAQGKHVLVEKPLTMDVKESEEIVAAARTAGRVLMCGHLFLYAPAVVEIRRLLREGSLGDLYFVTSTRGNVGPPETQVDVLWDLAPHDVSIILDLMGEAPSEVHAQGASFTDSGFSEAVFVTLRFPSGRLAHIAVNWLSPAKVRWMRVVCSGKTIHYDDSSATEKLRIYDAAVDNRRAAGASAAHAIGYGPGNITIPLLTAREPLRAECEDFIECIASGREPVSSGAKALEVVRVLHAASSQIATQSALCATSK